MIVSLIFGRIFIYTIILLRSVYFSTLAVIELPYLIQKTQTIRTKKRLIVGIIYEVFIEKRIKVCLLELIRISRST